MPHGIARAPAARSLRGPARKEGDAGGFEGRRRDDVDQLLALRPATHLASVGSSATAASPTTT